MKKKTKIYPWKMYFHVLLGMFFLLPALLNAQNATVKVSGIVTDTNNEPLIGVSVGRLREDTVYDWKFVGLSHNTVRGAAGGAVLCAETLKAKGYIQAK